MPDYTGFATMLDKAGNVIRVATLSEAATGVTEDELAAALAEIDITQDVVQNFVNNTFITELTQNQTFVEEVVNQITAVDVDNTYITQITQNDTYVQNFLTELTELTEITQNTTYVTNLITQIVAQINGKKGVASELATLDGGGTLTAAQVPASLLSAAIPFIIDGTGSAITTGIKGDLIIPFACTITEWTLLADQSGSIVVDVWKDTYANYPPTAGDSITASAKPTISSATKNQSSTLTGWTTSIAAGSTLRFNVDSATTVQRATLSLKVTRTV